MTPPTGRSRRGDDGGQGDHGGRGDDCGCAEDASSAAGDGRGERAVTPPRDTLFELAVARADAYLRRASRPASSAPADLRRALEPWARATRFASRIDLDSVALALAARPADPAARWRGGPNGGWG